MSKSVEITTFLSLKSRTAASSPILFNVDDWFTSKFFVKWSINPNSPNWPILVRCGFLSSIILFIYKAVKVRR